MNLQLKVKVEPALEACDPCRDDRWRQLTDTHGHLFHSPSWLGSLRDAYGLEPKAMLVGEGGLAWVDVQDMRGRRVRSLPFSDFGGPVGPVETGNLISTISGSWNRETPVGMRLIVGRPAYRRPDVEVLIERAGLSASGSLAWHWTDLVGQNGYGDGGEDVDPMWKALSSNARQNIRKARRSGVVVSVDDSPESLATFRLLHQRLRRGKYRLLSQPQAFFDALGHHFGDGRLAVVLAWSNGQPVAGVLLLRHRDWAYYKFNASNQEGWALRANDLVMWSALQTARAWGCRRFDHGVSDLDQPGLIRYKSKYASGAGEVVVLNQPATRSTWRDRQIDRGLSTVTRMMTSPRCPEAFAERSSRFLYRLFC